MTPEQLTEIGKQVARDIAAGIMAGVSAGAAEFARTMTVVQREAEAATQSSETDGMLVLADHIEQEREQIRAVLAGATGLKAAALRRRLQQLDQAESTLVQQLAGDQAPALPAAPTADEVIPVSRHRNGRFKPVNGSH